MGGDKALVTLAGRSFVARVVAALSPVAGRVVVVRRAGQSPLPFPTLVEPGTEDRHPLYGVAAALTHARSPVALLAPVDVPLLSTEAMAALLAAAPAVAVAAGQVHPLVAALPTTFGPLALRLAQAGAPARALVAGVTRVEVAPDLLADLDTPEDVLSRGGP